MTKNGLTVKEYGLIIGASRVINYDLCKLITCNNQTCAECPMFKIATLQDTIDELVLNLPIDTNAQ